VQLATLADPLPDFAESLTVVLLGTGTPRSFPGRGKSGVAVLAGSQVFVVDCGGGTHFVLSGLFRIDAEVGQTLQPGEPVGIMPSWDPRIPGSNKPLLYVELRRNGVPVNPAPFLRSGG